MRSLFFSSWVVVAGFGLGLQTLIAQPQPRAASDDTRLTDRSLVTSSAGDMAREFDGARESFLNIDPRDAGARIRRVIASMQERAQDATDAGRGAIQKSVAELESLAGAIEQRRLSSVRPLDEAFARANFALANNHLLLAIRAQNQHARQRIGEELNSAVEHFQQGTQRLGGNLRKDEHQLIQNTRQLTGKLIHGVGATTDEIGQGIRSFGQRLEQVQAEDTLSQPSSAKPPGIER
jgi:hypothetical protein